MPGITCPHCGLAMPTIWDLVGKTVFCPQCQGRFVMTGEPPPVVDSPPFPPPPVVQPPPGAPQNAPPMPSPFRSPPFKSTRSVPRRKHNPGFPSGPVALTIAGVLLGCFVGFFAAHHFAFFGGFVLMGSPYSPARYSLVPGHMLLCGILFGIAGFGIGHLLTRKAGN